MLKIRRISSMIKNGGENIFMIQETKISNMQEFCAKSFSIGYSFSNSSGLYGGLVTLWK